MSETIPVARGRSRFTACQAASLPVTQDITLAYVMSLAIVVTMAIASVVGILYAQDLYPARDQIQLPVVDGLNLVVGLPALLGSMWLARRGRLLGLLCWPGALFYVVYRYLASAIGVGFGVMFLPYLLLVALGAYTSIGLVASIDGEAVRQRLAGAVPARAAGAILVGATMLFIALDGGAIITALTTQPPSEPEHPVYVLITDFVTLIPACLVGGLLLWQRAPLGYVAGAGLLLVYSVLLIGPVPVLAVQAFHDGAPFPADDVLFLVAIASICIVPLGLFLRGMTRTQIAKRR
jgi:hypothetical protein